MQQRIDVWATSVGDLRFVRPLFESYVTTTYKIPNTFRIMLDTNAPTDQRDIIDWADEHDVEVVDPHLKWNEGLHSLWTSCVKQSVDTDICVVLNDDVWLTRGWLEGIVQVLSRNDHIGLCGIPCDDGVFKQIPNVCERWLAGDYSIFVDDNFARYQDTPAKLEHHTAGFCWATKPKLWLVAGCDRICDFGWGYGEVVMAIQMRQHGYETASIYVPCIYHYGGGSFGEDVNARNAVLSLKDAPLALDRYGTIHMHELMEKWNEETQCGALLPKVVYDL